MARKGQAASAIRTLEKAPTGITGLDEITGGGLPRGRPTLVCGPAGCGKTMLGMEFIAKGIMEFGEPGVIFTFEETAEDLITNVQSLGYDFQSLIRKKKLLIEHIPVDAQSIEEAGEYDLEGLFLRLGAAIDAVGARRVMLDTLETLFAGFTNHAILRSELARLFRWLKARDVSAVITAERGDGALTRHGLEEYVSDCVIELDHRVTEQVATRRIRVVKYRGSAHGTNEYPFLIDEDGIEVLPITSVGLNHSVSTERVSTGVDELDRMMGGGVYRGSSVLISGTAGAGKTSLSCCAAQAACRAGERCLYFAFEESPAQIMRNMNSIGLKLEPYVRQNLLRFHASRPTLVGLESHLALIQKHVLQFQPRLVIIDPISNFTAVGSPEDAKAMLLRLLDLLKSREITGVFTSLTRQGDALESTDVGVSSIIDTWILLRDVELNAERNRVLYTLKSRGMAHSRQMREFQFSREGIRLVAPYLGSEGVLTGASRVAQEAREAAEMQQRQAALEQRRHQFERRRAALEAQIAALQAELAGEAQEAAAAEEAAEIERQRRATARAAMESRRQP